MAYYTLALKVCPHVDKSILAYTIALKVCPHVDNSLWHIL